jgi:class I fructose-bisphosphate aldolase
VNLGKLIRLNRIFSHPTGRLCSVAVDHFISYRHGLPAGLTDLPGALAQIMAGGPDAVTMHKGTAMGCWSPYAGKAGLIIQAVSFTADDSVMTLMTSVEEVVRFGADAIAVSIGVRGPNEGAYLKMLCNKVIEAARYDLPVIAHIYPRNCSEKPVIVNDADNIAWAVRCGIECGADVIKVAYTGDVQSYAEIIRSCPVPIVAAGGPKIEAFEEALAQIAGVVASGARGATIGRNIWGSGKTTAALLAFKAIIHDTKTPREALQIFNQQAN